ncbi:MAG: hypothetical protein ACLRM8_10055 [Alistipes sp.]
MSPYDAYFGIGVTPQTSDWGDEYLDSKRSTCCASSCSMRRTSPGTEERVLVSVYKITSYWWWDAASDSQARYAKCAQHLLQDIADDPDRRRGQVAMRWSAGDYGYYMIRVTGSGHEHAATQVVCVSSSDWRGDVSSVTDAATRLAVTRTRRNMRRATRRRSRSPLRRKRGRW